MGIVTEHVETCAGRRQQHYVARLGGGTALGDRIDQRSRANQRNGIADRFADSTLAYQGYGSGLPLDELRAVISFATAGLTPDLTVLLDLPAEEGLARKSGDGRTRFEEGFDAAFHTRVADGFRALAAAAPARWRTFDARRPKGELADEIASAVGLATLRQ